MVQNTMAMQALRNFGQWARSGSDCQANCDLAQLVQQESIGIVVCLVRASMAQQLKALSAAPDEVAAMGQRAKRLYKERFGFKRSLLQYDQLLRSIR